MVEQRGLALGIDLGGTAIKVGVVSRSGEIIARGQRATEVVKGPAGVVANMAGAAREAVAAAGLTPQELDGAGIGAPGICDGPGGIVVSAGNLAWKNVPVAQLLSAELGMPVRLDNDANCAALGEQWCGAGRGARHMVMFTLGTGVGGGLILNGQIFHGATGWAGELGHVPSVPNGAPCTCGASGCLETVASATAMAAAARRAIESGEAPAMARMAEANRGLVDARLVIMAARDGDGPALAILREAGEYLGTAAATLVGALNPELVVVGGGASAAGELLLEPMRGALLAKAMPGPVDKVKVVGAQLGNDAGLIGAASLAWR